VSGDQVTPQLTVRRMVLKKFDGPMPNEGKVPLEAMVFENGVLVQVWHPGDGPEPTDFQEEETNGTD
jgi:hypothetical protein